MVGEKSPVGTSLQIVIQQLQEAIAAPICHQCGCLQQTVQALAETGAEQSELADILAQARSVFVPKKYDCLGCPVCYPAVAANAFAEAYPDAGAALDLCPTEVPEERHGWPPLPGDFTVVRYGAPVAVCTLNSSTLFKSLAAGRPEGLAIVGTMHTENLGIERVIKNTLANPNIRFLLLCGEDTQQAVGHLPGQSFVSLFNNGLDAQGSIIGARGKRPVLKNVSREEVLAFVQQVELVAMIGERDKDNIAGEIRACAARNPGANPYPFKDTAPERIHVTEAKRLVLDKAGYFVIYPDARNQHLIVEHYTNHGVLNCILEGVSTGALYSEAIERQLVTRLDHAAYLGRELARAEKSLLDGTPFVQDAAPGELEDAVPKTTCTGTSCGCSPASPTKGDCP